MGEDDSVTGRERLDHLRDGIDEIDREILRLLGERRAVVGRVAEIKQREGMPLYHPAREEDLISARRREARERGLDPDMVEDVFRRVLRSSRATQSQTLAAHAVRPGSRVLVVGGRGSMGRSLAAWFETAGYRVAVLDRDDWERVDALAAGVDLALLSVPISVTGEVARRLGPHLPRACVLADVASLKVEPLQAMLEAHRGPVMGLHPMFGPTTSALDKQIVVTTPGREDEACRWVLDQLAAWGAVVVPATAAEHDEAMAVVQSLRHFATFAFGQFLYRKGVNLTRTLEFSGPIYRLELGMVGRLFAQDPELYAEIIFASPERRSLLRDYAASVAANAESLEAGDRESFCREFRRVAEWFGPFSDQAIRESTYLIDKLVERF